MSSLRNTIPSSPTTGLTRRTVHQANGENIIGLPFCGVVVPIAFPSVYCGVDEDVIIQTGPVYHNDFQYEDLGIGQECCRQVYQFNIEHYFKHYLPGSLGTDGEITEPYQWNYCKMCDVGLEDACGHVLAIQSDRRWRRDRYIYQADKVLQNKTGRPVKFSAVRTVCDTNCKSNCKGRCK